MVFEKGFVHSLPGAAVSVRPASGALLEGEPSAAPHPRQRVAPEGLSELHPGHRMAALNLEGWPLRRASNRETGF